MTYALRFLGGPEHGRLQANDSLPLYFHFAALAEPLPFYYEAKAPDAPIRIKKIIYRAYQHNAETGEHEYRYWGERE